MQELRYRTVPGQDAAPLVAALRSAGYDAEPSTVAGSSIVVIASGDGSEPDPEQVRSVIQEANKTSVFDGGQVEAPVRFEGEQ